MIVSTILRFFHTCLCCISHAIARDPEWQIGCRPLMLYLPFCSPEDMGGLEMHGTGTSLGDPIEFGAAFEVLGSSRAGADPTLDSRYMSCIKRPSVVVFDAPHPHHDRCTFYLTNQYRDAFLAPLRYSGSGGADGGALQARGRILKPYRVVI